MLDADEHLLEIGAGAGDLSRFLLDKVVILTDYEPRRSSRFRYHPRKGFSSGRKCLISN